MKEVNVTKHQDINEILTIFSRGLQEILGKNLVGIYLTGSLTYGDFDRGSSDIDLLIVLTEHFTEKQREKVKKLHDFVEKKYPVWAQRIEASYITKSMLQKPSLPKYLVHM